MGAFFNTGVKALRDFEWLDESRARAYSRILVGLTLVVALSWIVLSSGGTRPRR